MSDFGIKVQAAINGLDDGIIHSLLQVILFISLGIALASGFAWSQFRGLDSAEAMEYAQLARNISEGDGFVTRTIRPVDFQQLGIDAESKAEISPLPELRKGPVYPLLLAFGFKIAKMPFATLPDRKLFEPEAKVIMPTGIIFMILTALIVFFIGLKLFSQRVAVLSMILTLVNGTLLSYAISGTPMPIAILKNAESYRIDSCIVLLSLNGMSNCVRLSCSLQISYCFLKCALFNFYSIMSSPYFGPSFSNVVCMLS